MADGLLDIKFGLVAAPGGVVPQALSGAETVGELFQILLCISSSELPWLPVAGDVTPIIFEPLDRKKNVKAVEQILTVVVAKFLPFVTLEGVRELPSFGEKTETAVEVSYRYRGQPASVLAVL